MAKPPRSSFERTFEGPDILDELLTAAGANAAAEDVVEQFRDAQANGLPASEAVPLLFDQEPHFGDAELARRLYQNLLGLWDLLASGGKPPSRAALRAPRPTAPPKPNPPPPFAKEGPDTEWIGEALRYLGGVDLKPAQRLEHAFENRQHGLLQTLDERNFSDEAWSTARGLFFELFAFVELGWPPGVGSVEADQLHALGTSMEGVPPALRAYVEEALHEAVTDDALPLPEADVERLSTMTKQVAKALWQARRPA